MDTRRISARLRASFSAMSVFTFFIVPQSIMERSSPQWVLSAKEDVTWPSESRFWRAAKSWRAAHRRR